MRVVLTGVEWNLNADLIFVSFIAKDVEHFFMYLLTVYTSFENCIQFLCPFINWIIWFLPLKFLSSLYILDINPLSDE
jgi:hypothetical protein